MGPSCAHSDRRRARKLEVVKQYAWSQKACPEIRLYSNRFLKLSDLHKDSLVICECLALMSGRNLLEEEQGNCDKAKGPRMMGPELLTEE